MPPGCSASGTPRPMRGRAHHSTHALPSRFQISRGRQANTRSDIHASFNEKAAETGPFRDYFDALSARKDLPSGLDVDLNMRTPAEAAKNTIEIAKRHIAGQCQRIEQQYALIKRLERDGHIDLVAEAVRQLAAMRDTLAQMEADYAAARERLAQATVDEPSLAKVEKDTPM